MNRPSRLAVLCAHALAVPVALLFLYPYWWMLIGAFRTTRAMMSDPLRLLPESFDLSIFGQIARIGGVDLWSMPPIQPSSRSQPRCLASRSPRPGPTRWFAGPTCRGSRRCGASSSSPSCTPTCCW